MRIANLLLLFLFILSMACKRKEGKFVKLAPAQTGIHFNNLITENDSVNVFAFANIYNGGGVGIGDFNNDGLQDIYFTGNMVSNKLYLNQSNFKFNDITDVSGTNGGGVWSRGVAVVDINNDGKLDIYVCATAKARPEQRVNLLYVNQGNNKDSVPVFKEMAKEYGLADNSQSTMAYFFDYDNDGDLDLFIAVNHVLANEYANTFRKRNLNGEHPSTSRLYRNEWSDSLKHPVYTDVSRQAGILIEGYTHAAGIFDFNDDGWMDILETNDYLSSNVLYINNQNGTFTDQAMDYFKHTAFNSMGTDVVDINNDGLRDVVEVDMDPQDNYRKKMFQGPGVYQFYINNDLYGYQYQYPRNMLQLNMGQSVGTFDTLKHPVFGDIGFFTGMAETDWSWTPLVADFDRDGNKDIIYTNGFPKDITDRDFVTYSKQAMRLATKQQILAEIPEVKIHNYAYKNTGKLQFSEESTAWGLEEPGFSNGAAYADLDNDGDLDIVINNIDDPAAIYENRLSKQKDSIHSLSIRLSGPAKNINAIGATVSFYQKGQQQYFENMPYRGYLSTQSLIINAGMGNDARVDSVLITWPDKRILKFTDVATDQQLFADYSKSLMRGSEAVQLATNNWFTNITPGTGISFTHAQTDYIDFNVQKLLPHKFSEYAPAIATGDINGDGLDDFIVGGSPGYSAMLFTAGMNGKFKQRALITDLVASKKEDDRGLLLFDADSDGDLDLYISSGGYNYLPNDSTYQDRFYLNDGKGGFKKILDAFPLNHASKLCVRACDYDKDGDLDLFISGRVVPQEYPKPVNSFIYRNDSKKGAVKFIDVTASVAPALKNIGISCDALFTDYDNDGWQDLIVAGEWMSIVILHNEKGVYKDVSKGSGVFDKSGWWTSIIAGDFDNDNDIDYVIGNLGLNSFFRASPKMPVRIRAKDFDGNNSYDAIPSLFLPATLEPGSPWQEFPAYGRDDMIKQMIGTRVKFQNYKSYANAVIDSLVSPASMKGAQLLEAGFMSSVYMRNDGAGHFTMNSLPAMAQFSTLNGMVADDFDGDGNLDIAINTNDYGTDVLTGRYDALNGLVLKGSGNGDFTPLSAVQSGIFINGNGKALSRLKGANNEYLLIATQNRGALEVYKNKNSIKMVSVGPDAISATIELPNGRRQRTEFYWGSSFLSQSNRMLVIPGNARYEVNVEKRTAAGEGTHKGMPK